MLVSIIVSIYNEEKALPYLLDEIRKHLKQLYNTEQCRFEMIFVNDGSTDNSLNLLNEFSDNNLGDSVDIRIISLSRNFGHEAAMIAGIDHSNGDINICMDGDLQHPVSEIENIISCYRGDGYDIINMIRDEKAKKFFPTLFYTFLNFVSHSDIVPNASDFFMISKKVADILRKDYRERIRFLRGYIQEVGFKRMNLTYRQKERQYGKSKYSLLKLFSFSFEAISTMSIRPLRIGMIAALGSGVFSLFLMIYSLLMKVVQQPVSGYTTLIVFLSAMFSIQFFILGIIGEYIGFLFYEQKRRPIYIVEHTNFETNDKVEI